MIYSYRVLRNSYVFIAIKISLGQGINPRPLVILEEKKNGGISYISEEWSKDFFFLKLLKLKTAGGSRTFAQGPSERRTGQWKTLASLRKLLIFFFYFKNFVCKTLFFLSLLIFPILHILQAGDE